MAQHYFPTLIMVDLENIKEATYSALLETISGTTERIELEDAMRKLPKNKAPGPDEISSRILANYSKTLSKNSTELLTHVF